MNVVTRLSTLQYILNIVTRLIYRSHRSSSTLPTNKKFRQVLKPNLFMNAHLSSPLLCTSACIRQVPGPVPSFLWYTILRLVLESIGVCTHYYYVYTVLHI